MSGFRSACLSALPVVALLASCSSTGSVYTGAEYETLKAENYTTSNLTTNKAGQRGWQVSNGEKTYFCKLTATIMVIGTPASNIMDHPNKADIDEGRPRPQDVGKCRLI